MADEPARTWRVLSFPPSNDCDLTRWVLEHYGVPYEEELHTVVFLQRKSKAVGGAGGFPTLYRGTDIVNGMDEVLWHFDPEAPEDRRLLPQEPKDREAVEKLWSEFHGGIGFAAARWAYALLLPHCSIMVRPLSHQCPWYERVLVFLLYPLVRLLIRKGLQIPEDPAPELAAVRKAFDRVDELLSDGRSLLVGDRPTIADFGFAAMAVPAVWPAEYGGAVPAFEDLPSELREEISKLRERPAGKFALRMYREHRRPSP